MSGSLLGVAVDPLIQNLLDVEGSDDSKPIEVDRFDWITEMTLDDVEDIFRDVLRRKGLWPLIPGVTKGMLDDWNEMHEEQVEEDAERDPRLQQAKAAAAQGGSNVNTAQKKPVVNGNAK